jgi:hypothetical protein
MPAAAAPAISFLAGGLIMVPVTGREAHILHLRDHWPTNLADKMRGLVRQHTMLRHLCDRLETIADRLPQPPEAVERDAVCHQLRRLVPRHRQDEQALLARLFPDRDATAADRHLLGVIHGQHAQDEIHAQDLSLALEATGPDNTDPPLGAETLGYMLRCFFDGFRRALDFEELAMLTMGGRRLPAALAAILAHALGQQP